MPIMKESYGPFSDQMNRHFLASACSFRENSLLRSFLAAKYGFVRFTFSVGEILSMVKEVIRRENLYCQDNPAIVKCTQEIEDVFGLPYLFYGDIRQLVVSHLDICPDQTSIRSSSPLFDESVVNFGRWNCYEFMSSSIPTSHLEPGKNYYLRPRFLSFIRSLPGVNPNEVLFSFERIHKLLFSYIMADQESILFACKTDSQSEPIFPLNDPRREFVSRLASLENNPLGIALGVNIFHRSQLSSLLKAVLIPHEVNGTHPNPDFLYPPPCLNSLIRIPIVQNPVLSIHTDGNLIINPVISHGQIAAPTVVYDAQIPSTSSNIQIPPEVSDEELVEYDIGSDHDIKRPPQAMGRNPTISTLDDTDTDTGDITPIIPTAMKGNNSDEESNYWADNDDNLYPASSGEELDVPSNSFSEYCPKCHMSNENCLRYCTECWQERKSWIPNRPKGRKRRRASPHPRVISTEYTNFGKSKHKSNVDVIPEGFPNSSLSMNPVCPPREDGTAIPVHHYSDNTPQSSSTHVDVPDKLVKKPSTLKLCIFCTLHPGNACFVHGRTAHQVACYSCAKRCWDLSANCPVCRRKISQIVNVLGL